MNIVIIEDELPAYNRMAKMLKEINPIAQVIAHHDSVQSAWKWFMQNPLPDLLLLDIQLADGTAFDLLKLVKIDCPIIFTTAFDQYAIEAFKTTSIDYLLKPIKKADLEQAFQKLKEFQHVFRLTDTTLQKIATATQEYKKRFIVRFGEHIKTISVDNVAYFCSENKATFARTLDNHNFPMDHNLDTLEKLLDPKDFFRVNRQYLISLKSIEEMRTYSKARVIIKLAPAVKEPPVVSSKRAADFKLWLAGDL